MKPALLIIVSGLYAAGLFAQPIITTQPANQAALSGGTATFSVSATGAGPFTYQWQHGGTNLPASLITTAAGGGVGDGGAATNAEVNHPLAAAADGAGNLFIVDYGNNRIRKVGTNGIITTVAGNGNAGYAGDGGPATNATLSTPNGVAVDTAGNLFIADYYNQRIRKVGTNGIITTVAGKGSSIYSGDGGAATNAGVPYPCDVAVDTTGNLFIVDPSNNRIRKVGTDGVITTFAGNGTNGYSGDGGAATNAELYSPAGVTVDTAGNLFIADLNNHRIRKVATNGIITTVAGCSSHGFSGDGGLATNAALGNPPRVAVDVVGNLFIADPDNNRVREVGTNGIIATVAGNGTNGCTGDGGAATNAAIGLYGDAVDATGNLFLADSGDNRIRKVATNGIITTVAGNGTQTYAGNGCTAPNAQFYYPVAVALDPAGDLFITDQFNVRIRRVDTNNIITTVAGNGLNGYAGDGGPAIQGKLYEPIGVAADGAGNVFIADWDNYRIREVGADGIITTAAGGGSQTPSTGTVATNAHLNSPSGLALDAAGNLIFSDYNYLRKLGTNGLLTPLAGTGYGGYSGDGAAATQAMLDGPSGVAADPAGDVFIADTGNQRIRRVDTNGVITTVAGNGINGHAGDGGAATNAQLYNPSGVAVDAAGDLFIADTLNHRIRTVDINGIITTVAGSGVSGFAGDGGAATSAKLAEPNGLAIDGVGNLFIADTYNHRIRKVSPFASLPTLTLNNVASNNAGDYQVIVTGAGASVTSSVMTLTVVLWQPAIISATLNPNGSLTLNLASPSGATSRLWAATNLTPPVVWQGLTTNLTGGNWQFTDAGTPSCQTRFYRLSVP